MDQNNNVCLFEEEEKSGWTILTTVPDREPGEKLSTHLESDPELNKDFNESGKDANDSSASEEKGKVEKEDRDDVEEVPSKEDSDDAEEVPSTEDSDDAEEFRYLEGDDHADDELTDYGVDEGAEEDGFPFDSPAERGYVWETKPVMEAGVKQTLVEQQSTQKQGLIWRVSLVATLGFFGWVVLTGLGGGGKHIRCLKLHSCSLKEGEPVLSTL